ncbi:MFS transporter [Aureimonas mangrovi]|uniref:MFS transporter n=1 Tax=Aureimonas mangrovi TaxID=2758041 RepID=UPI00163DA680|nr:MFS transporter [Aureimonas mangrovi]
MAESARGANPGRLLAGGGGLLVLTYLGFVSLGLPDASYGVAWPSLRDSFMLREGAFGLGLAAVGIGFLCSSLSAGSLLRRFGVGRLLGGSTLIAGLGLAGFAFAPSWPIFLAFGLAVGLGGGAIDSGLNAYAAGHYSARQMNWLHAAFGLGAALGPLAMTAAVAADQWRIGYGALSATMIALSVLFIATRRLWAAAGGVSAAHDSATAPAPVREAIRHKGVQLQTLAFFVYAGLEIGLGQWAFAVLSQTRGLSVEAAGFWTGVFWFMLFAGRVLLGFGADRIGPARLVGGGAAVSLASVLWFVIDPGGSGVLGLALAGFALAPIFPMLMHMTPERVGRELAGHAVGFQVSAAMTGGVVIPSLAGFVAGWWGLGAVPTFFLIVAVIYFALSLRLSAISVKDYAIKDR